MLTPEQIETRRKGIGASEIAAVFGRHPFQSPADLYMIKRGMVPPPEVNVDMKRGNFLEDGIAKWTAADLDLTLVMGSTITHPEIPVAIATPDRLIVPADYRERSKGDSAFPAVEGLLEIKSPRRNIGWAAPEVDPQGIPEYIMLQLQWQLGIGRAYYESDFTRGIVSALIYGERSTYDFTFNQELFDFLTAGAVEWWDRHIIHDEAPEIDGSKGAAAYLDKMFPANKTDVIKDSDANVETAIFALKELETQAKEVDRAKKEAQNRIKAFIGSDTGVAGPWGKILYRKSKDSESFDAKAMAAFIEVNHPRKLASFKKTRLGSRSFRVNWSE